MKVYLRVIFDRFPWVEASALAKKRGVILTPRDLLKLKEVWYWSIQNKWEFTNWFKEFIEKRRNKDGNKS